MEELFAGIMKMAITLKLIAKRELPRMIVDSTVQEKTMAHPTDIKIAGEGKMKGGLSRKG